MTRLAILCILCWLCVESSAQEFRVDAGEGWIPLSFSRDVEAGSALDFSEIVPRDAPAGKHGFVRAVGGHFEFEGRPGVPQRFFGANLCMEANYPRTDEEADRLVERLVRCGYNSVRIHHHDGAWNGDHIDRLDRFLAKAFAAGIYVTTDLYVSRKVTWREIGIDRDGAEGLDYKTMLFVHDGAFENWKKYARAFLSHRNPYTGRTYAEEPGIACLCLVNENSIQQGIAGKSENPYLKDAWRRWLLERRSENPGCWPSLSPDEIPVSGGGWSGDAILKGEAWDAVSRFCADLERRMFGRMRGFLRGELGVRIPLTDQNWGTQSGPMQEVRAELYDYADAHYYFDHPKFPGGEWRLPSTLENENPLKADAFGVETAWRRVAGKPFVLSEWNFCGPSRFRSSGALIMGALAAAQDWSALWRFSFSHWFTAFTDEPAPPGYFDAVKDPVILLSERLAASLFLRGDLPPMERGIALELAPEAVAPASGDHAWNVMPQWWTRHWGCKVATVLPGKAPPGYRSLPLHEAATNEPPSEVDGMPPGISINRASGTFAVATPATCAVFAENGTHHAGALKVSLSATPATIWATALDGAPLAESSRILVCHLTDVQGEGAVFGDSSMRRVLAWGTRPLARAGKAEVELRLDNPAEWRVWALSTSGARLRIVPSSFDVASGILHFTADVAADPASATCIYEIVRQ